MPADEDEAEPVEGLLNDVADWLPPIGAFVESGLP